MSAPAMCDMELLDTLQAAALQRGDMVRVKQLADRVDMLNRLAGAVCPESVLSPDELVGHVYRVADAVESARSRKHFTTGTED